MTRRELIDDVMRRLERFDVPVVFFNRVADEDGNPRLTEDSPLHLVVSVVSSTDAQDYDTFISTLTLQVTAYGLHPGDALDLSDGVRDLMADTDWRLRGTLTELGSPPWYGEAATFDQLV